MQLRKLFTTENNTVVEAVDYDIPLLFKKRELNNFVYEQFRDSWTKNDVNKFDTSTKNAIWKTLPIVLGEAQTGYHETTLRDIGNCCNGYKFWIRI